MKRLTLIAQVKMIEASGAGLTLTHPPEYLALRDLLPKSMKVFRNLKYWVYGPSGSERLAPRVASKPSRGLDVSYRANFPTTWLLVPQEHEV